MKGNYNFMVLWTTMMGEGTLDVSTLKKIWSGYSTLDNRTMDFDKYREAMHTHKMITRAVNAEEDRGDIHVKRDRLGKAVEIKLTEQGINKIMPADAEGLLAYAPYPSTVHIYNTTGDYDYSLIKDKQPTQPTFKTS